MDMPTAEDYIKAVQNPRSFTQPRLAAAMFDKHPLLGIPMPASGTTAIVFKATVEGEPQALRFFTRPDAATQQRYTALNRFFTDRNITHDMATSTWVDNAITVNGHTWPMLRMQWVQGRTLNHHVEDLVEDEDTASIQALADNWRDLVRRLRLGVDRTVRRAAAAQRERAPQLPARQPAVGTVDGHVPGAGHLPVAAGVGT
jgi:hypothetical protein